MSCSSKNTNVRTVSRQDGRWQSRLLSGSMKFFYLLLSAKVIGVFSFFLYRACDLTRHQRWRTIVIKELKIITTGKERKDDNFFIVIKHEQIQSNFIFVFVAISKLFKTRGDWKLIWFITEYSIYIWIFWLHLTNQMYCSGLRSCMGWSACTWTAAAATTSPHLQHKQPINRSFAARIYQYQWPYDTQAPSHEAGQRVRERRGVRAVVDHPQQVINQQSALPFPKIHTRRKKTTEHCVQLQGKERWWRCIPLSCSTNTGRAATDL